MLNLEQQIFKQLEKSQNVLLVFSPTSSGDSLASALALFLFMKKLGKKVEIAEPYISKKQQLLKFLPAYTDVQTNLQNLRHFIVSLNIHEAKINQIKYTLNKDLLNFIISPATGWFKPEDITTRVGEFKYDLIITIGVNNLESLEKIYDNNVEFFYKTPLINIDNESNNEDFGQINFIDLNAITNAEIIFYLLKNYKPQLITEDISTCLLAGIIKKTKNFKTIKLTPRTLLTTSKLISLGARQKEIIKNLYYSRDISSLKLWGKILNNLKTKNNSELLWSHLKQTDFEETETNSDNLEGVIDELITSIPQAKIIVIFYEETPNKTKVIIYTLKNINALDLLKKYSPQGNNRNAQTTLNQNLEITSTKILSEFSDKLDKSNL
jgi:nanoRNase/pAp phosphatase (c-di-AMP/oligoRNAs hydrolase)